MGNPSSTSTKVFVNALVFPPEKILKIDLRFNLQNNEIEKQFYNAFMGYM